MGGDMTPARRWPLPAVVFLVVLLAGQAAVGMRASRTASVTGDEPFYLLTTQSLVSDGDIDLRDEYAKREYSQFWDGRVELWKQMEPAPDGRLLSPHEPGLSLLTVPAYAVGGLRGVQRFLVLLWAAAMAAAAVVARRYGAPPAAAGMAATVVGVGTPGIVYASQVYPEGAAALCVAVAMLVVTGAKARPVVIAVALVALAWLGIKYGAMGVLLGGAWAWRFRRDRRALGVAVALAAVSGAHYVWWHLDTFGGLTPYGTNVVWAGEGTADVVDAHLRLEGRPYRLYGLFLDARFGLFRWLPAAALAVLAVGRRTALPTMVVAISVIVGTFVSITMMGWWFPGRMLVAALPGLVALVALGTARVPRVAMGLSLWSVAIAAALVYAARTADVRLAVDPFTLGFPLAPDWLFPDFRSFGVGEVVLSAAWGAGLLSARAIVATRSRSSPIPVTDAR